MKFIVTLLLVTITVAIECAVLTYCPPPAFTTDAVVYNEHSSSKQSTAFDHTTKKSRISQTYLGYIEYIFINYMIGDDVYHVENGKCYKSQGRFPQLDCLKYEYLSLTPVTISGAAGFVVDMNNTQLYITKDKYPDTYGLIFL
ncbi:hypothetical protein AKO1_013868 [Acrasis kona]|uniref:Uncharacterized protein n=1 Tax=Acrasis kona TaxID=1008807 RepID=A0AAW2ZH12_9EUKA